MPKMSDKEYFTLMFITIGIFGVVFGFALIDGLRPRAPETREFTFFYVEVLNEEIPEYFVMTIEDGEVYFRGNISEPKAGARYRITYIWDRSVKVRRYVVEKCEAIE